MRTSSSQQTGTAALAMILFASLALAQQPAAETRAPREIEKLNYPKLHDIQLPAVIRETLPNGLRLLLVEDHELPRVEFHAIVKGGRVAEPKGKPGLAELFGEVQRTGGTKTMSGDKADELLERLGASVEAGVSEAYGNLSGKSLVENLDTVLPVFADFLMAPAFAQDKVDLAKTHLKSAIARRNDQVQGISQREIRKLIFGADSPYARQYEYDDVDALTRADLLAFHAHYYRPDATILAVWGDFQATEMKARLAKTLGSWQTADLTASPPVLTKPTLPPPVTSVNYIEKKDVEQTFIVMGHLGLRLDDPDYPAVNMLSEILGGGFSSRIFVSVRTTKGLAYSAGCWMSPAYDHLGTFSFFTSTKPATTTEAISTILDEIKKIREAPVTEAELRRAKEGYLNGYAFEYDSTAKIVNRQALYEFFGYPADFNVRLRDAIEKVTREDILRVAGKHLKPEALTILAVGRAELFDKPLSTFGKVTTIDIKIPEPKSREPVAEATPENLKAGTGLLIKAAKAAGEQALLGLKDIHSESVATVKSPMGQIELKAKIVFVLPNRLRAELTTPVGTMIQVFDQDKAWMKMGEMTQDLPESAAGELRRNLYTMNGGALLLKQALEGKMQGQALGKTEFEGKEAEAVLFRVGESPLKVFLSADATAVLGFKYAGQTPEGPAEMVETVSSFQEVSGLRLPMEHVQKAKGEVQATGKASSIKLNQGWTEDMFTKPAAAK
jgi:zinc protease